MAPRERLVDRRAVQPELLERLRGVELMPEVVGDVRRRRPGRSQDFVDESKQRSCKIPGPQTIHGGSLAFDDRVLKTGIRDDRVHQCGHVHGIRVVE